jgi:NADP-dependent 3-hydroxy acid dehydrogenase YdfG
MPDPNWLTRETYKNKVVVVSVPLFQSVSPGLVRTELPPKELLDTSVSLEAKDIADGVLYALGTPPHVQVCLLRGYNQKFPD